MDIRVGDVIGENGKEFELEKIVEIQGVGTFMQWKGIEGNLYPMKRLNMERYQELLIRRGK
jgi:hypothetical protein